MRDYPFSTVYGPVKSWRVGNSLGIDLICEISTCSFNCVYCQLGFIQRITMDRREFIPTAKVMEDLRAVDLSKVDVITFTGSGEPTLATNIGEAIHGVKQYTKKPILILTNATTFHLPEVREAIQEADQISAKLDAANEEHFQRVNRPAPGVTLSGVVQNIQMLRKEYRGKLNLQIMFMPKFFDLEELIPWSELIRKIQPDTVELNTPTRPYPTGWYLQSRGSHGGVPYPAKPLPVISWDQAKQIEEELKKLTGVKIVSVYRNGEESGDVGL